MMSFLFKPSLPGAFLCLVLAAGLYIWDGYKIWLDSFEQEI